MANNKNMSNGSSDPIYGSLRSLDHELDSLTDVEDIDLDDKDYLAPAPSHSHEPSARLTRRGRLLAACRRHRWLLDTALLLVILALLLERRWSRADGGGGGVTHAHEGAGDVTGFAPRFSQKLTRFAPDPLFMPKNTSEFFTDARVREKWLSIVPKGLGYLDIKNPREYDDLPVPVEGQLPGQYVVTTSMTHQLHCLHAIAEVYASITSNHSAPTETPWHLAHCFDYLRQGIMCCGDVAVEGKETTFPKGVIGSDGWDATHVCKDYGQVTAHLLANRANDLVWI